jgi:hypothetical protein
MNDELLSAFDKARLAHQELSRVVACMRPLLPPDMVEAIEAAQHITRRVSEAALSAGTMPADLTPEKRKALKANILEGLWLELISDEDE